MSDILRVLKLAVDVQNNEVVTDAGAANRRDIILFRGTSALFHLDLQNEDETAFKPDPASIWNFNIDSVFTKDHPDLTASDDSQFNISGDRDDLDVSQGKISFRVDTSTTELRDDLGDVAEKQMFGEVFMTPPGENTVLMVQFTIRMKNIVSDPSTTSDLVFTRTDLLRADGDDTILLLPDGTVAQRWTP